MDLETRFHQEMVKIYYSAKDIGYVASIFFDMVTKDGGLRTAKALINYPKVSSGYTALYERHNLKLTVEAVVVENPEWHELFDPSEISRARKRLLDYGYVPTIRG